MSMAGYKNGVSHDDQPVLTRSARPSQADEPQPLLIAQVGGRAFALPVATVERILRMAEITPMPGASKTLVGVVNYRGTVLPVVDPRPSLGVASAAHTPDQYLVLVAGASRFFLWVDHVESLVWVDNASSVSEVDAPVARLEGRVLPILSPSQWDPRTGLLQTNLLVERVGARR